MHGYPIRVELEGLGITLRPFKQSEMENFASLFGSMNIHRYTMGTSAYTTDDEVEWWKKTSNDQHSAVWAIVPDGGNIPIGTTGLHDIHPFWGSCNSGIIIADSEYWGKGIAYRAHLARTWYAAITLNRMSIQSAVRVPNEASLKALLKVGYRISGKHDRNVYRDGLYLDTFVMSWINPLHTEALYPDGIPMELKESLKKAKEALDLASKVVKFI